MLAGGLDEYENSMRFTDISGINSEKKKNPNFEVWFLPS